MPRNNIHGAEAGKAFADMLAQNTVLKELDLSHQYAGSGGNWLDAAFAKEFAVGISDNGAMTSLNLSGNNLGAEGAKHIAEGIKVSKCVVAVVLVPIPSPSDHWLNGCCLLLLTG
jgi:Ran GTPase-activating protein (RanGAP) involved in mRNA processing and transport